MYILRLDDASEYCEVEKWDRMTSLLNKFQIKPIFGIIPKNEDPELVELGYDSCFWEKVGRNIKLGWIPALHGYTHVTFPCDGGMNPINKRSEFVGLSFEEQAYKVREGLKILNSHFVNPEVFFAPAHTFDTTTLSAIKATSSIRIISDTVACDTYYENGFYFIPQQSGNVRRIPFKTVTFCYHPNFMKDDQFRDLEQFIALNRRMFSDLKLNQLKKRKRNLLDIIAKEAYFIRKR